MSYISIDKAASQCPEGKFTLCAADDTDYKTAVEIENGVVTRNTCTVHEVHEQLFKSFVKYAKTRRIPCLVDRSLGTRIEGPATQLHVYCLEQTGSLTHFIQYFTGHVMLENPTSGDTVVFRNFYKLRVRDEFDDMTNANDFEYAALMRRALPCKKPGHAFSYFVIPSAPPKTTHTYISIKEAVELIKDDSFKTNILTTIYEYGNLTKHMFHVPDENTTVENALCRRFRDGATIVPFAELDERYVVHRELLHLQSDKGIARCLVDRSALDEPLIHVRHVTIFGFDSTGGTLVTDAVMKDGKYLQPPPEKVLNSIGETTVWNMMQRTPYGLGFFYYTCEERLYDN